MTRAGILLNSLNIRRKVDLVSIKKNFIQTIKGNLFDYDSIETNIFDIDDIAHSLSNQCRWAGHTREFYSVGQHSVLCARQAFIEGYDYPTQFECLMHDGPEAYVVDLPRPLKRAVPEYCVLEMKIESEFRKRFNLPESMSPDVRIVDDRMLITEYFQLIDNNNGRFHETSLSQTDWQPFTDLEIVPWTPEKTKKEFLREYHYLYSIVNYGK